MRSTYIFRSTQSATCIGESNSTFRPVKCAHTDCVESIVVAIMLLPDVRQKTILRNVRPPSLN